MRDFCDGFRKEAFAAKVLGLAKKHPRLSLGLAAGVGGLAVGALAGSAVQKSVNRTGSINPHALQEEFRKRQMDRYGSY